MIVRLVTAIISDRCLAAYLRHLQKRLLPEYEAAEGLVSVSISQRPTGGVVELLTASVWKSEDSMNQFFARDHAAAASGDDHAVIHLEPRSYELVVSHASSPLL
jgi:heme-degrading monooxygenase HmoA